MTRARDQRQLNLLRRLAQSEWDGRIASLGPIIANIEALIGELEQVAAHEVSYLRQRWALLEEYYAVAVVGWEERGVREPESFAPEARRTIETARSDIAARANDLLD